MLRGSRVLPIGIRGGATANLYQIRQFSASNPNFQLKYGQGRDPLKAPRRVKEYKHVYRPFFAKDMLELQRKNEGAWGVNDDDVRESLKKYSKLKKNDKIRLKFTFFHFLITFLTTF